MKKNAFLISAAAFVFAGCQQEKLEPEMTGSDAVRITVNIDGKSSTKAVGDGTSIDYVWYEVYDENGTRIFPETGSTFPDAEIENSVQVIGGKAVIDNLQLLKNKKYTFVFWAMSAGSPYTWTDLGNISMNYVSDGKSTAEGNVERDAFFGKLDVETAGGIDESITLKRPFSQLNFGTGKEEIVFEEGKAYVKTVIGTAVNKFEYTGSTVKVSSIATKFNAIDAEASEPEEITFECSDIIGDPLKAGEPEKEYAYISMNYLLASGKTGESSVLDVDASFKINVDGQEKEMLHSLSNIPIQANYRTNLLGSIFTGKGSLEVSLGDWEGAEDHELWDGSLTPVVPDAEGVYNITTASELAWVADQVNSGKDDFEGDTIRLAEDIDLLGYTWIPIGTEEYPFEGTFDGAMPAVRSLTVSNVHTISNMTVNVTDTHAGLFGVVNGATISNFILKNAYVTNADNTTLTSAGTAIGKAIGSTIENIHAIESSVSGACNLGGLIGNADISPINCSVSDITVTLDQSGIDEAHEANIGTIVGEWGAENIELDPSNTGEHKENYTEGYVVKDGIYYIHDANGLAWLAEQVNTGAELFSKQTVVLASDIDLKSGKYTPIGNGSNSFQGIFDGDNHTVSNLVIDGGTSSNIGLFGHTTKGEIKNLTVHNALVSGRLNVGVVAGTPYTSKFTNIKVTGHVEVNGMSYVGGVGGKNAYTDWTDVTVDVDSTSYVNANSIEGTTAYRTYVGGVVGFNGEGNHSFTRITSNINVTGTTCDVGGLFGIAHYGNSFIDCSCSGNVEITSGTEESDAYEIGGIAGVWHNGADVTFTNCTFTGKLTSRYTTDSAGSIVITELADFPYNGLCGKAYSATGVGKLIIDGVEQE